MEDCFESDKDLDYETLFDENIIRTVTHVVQYEKYSDNDSVQVDTAKLHHRVKALELALRYVEQWLTAFLVKLRRKYVAKC